MGDKERFHIRKADTARVLHSGEMMMGEDVDLSSFLARRYVNVPDENVRRMLEGIEGILRPELFPLPFDAAAEIVGGEDIIPGRLARSLLRVIRLNNIIHIVRQKIGSQVQYAFDADGFRAYGALAHYAYEQNPKANDSVRPVIWKGVVERAKRGLGEHPINGRIHPIEGKIKFI